MTSGLSQAKLIAFKEKVTLLSVTFLFVLTFNHANSPLPICHINYATIFTITLHVM
jgi:hypothetical protein